MQWLTIGAALLTVAMNVRAQFARDDRGRVDHDKVDRGAGAGPILLWLAIVAVTLFLMTEAAVGVWERVPALAFLQFPWRLLMAIAVATSALVALLLARVRNARLQAIVGLVVVLAHVLLVHAHLQPSSYHEGARLDIDRPAWRYADPAQSAAFIEGGYHPIGVRRLPEGRIGRWTIARGEGRIRARTVRDDELRLDVETRDGLQLTINTPYFPGWRLALDGREIPAPVHPELGFMQVTIPAGRHTLDARFTDTPIRRWANLLSAGSLALFALLLIVTRQPRATPRPA